MKIEDMILESEFTAPLIQRIQRNWAIGIYQGGSENSIKRMPK